MAKLTRAQVRNPATLHAILTDLLTDVTAAKTSIATLTAQLDADGGVTGTDFAANCDMPALTTTAGDAKTRDVIQ